MLTPVEFLLARVTDLEQVAREATPGPWIRTGGKLDVFVEPDREDAAVVAEMWFHRDQNDIDHRIADADHIATWDPAFVLAWCAAVRNIVSVHHQVRLGWCTTCDIPGDVQGSQRGCFTIRALLQPFADHPDFDPAWRQEEA